jgi:hypothetical protein
MASKLWTIAVPATLALFASVASGTGSAANRVSGRGNGSAGWPPSKPITNIACCKWLAGK